MPRSVRQPADAPVPYKIPHTAAGAPDRRTAAGIETVWSPARSLGRLRSSGHADLRSAPNPDSRCGQTPDVREPVGSRALTRPAHRRFARPHPYPALHRARRPESITDGYAPPAAPRRRQPRSATLRSPRAGAQDLPRWPPNKSWRAAPTIHNHSHLAQQRSPSGRLRHRGVLGRTALDRPSAEHQPAVSRPTRCTRPALPRSVPIRSTQSRG